MKNSKVVHYSGMTFYVPSWANYITTDCCGNIFIFEYEPKYFNDGYSSGWIGNETTQGNAKVLYEPLNSETSLVKIGE